MSENKWTPGPWGPACDFRSEDGSLSRQIISKTANPPANEAVAHVDRLRDEYRKREHANVFLISAAPELFSALETIVRSVDCGMDECPISEELLQQAKSALSKAKGGA